MQRAALALALLLAACASGPGLPAPNTIQARYVPQQAAVQVLVSTPTPVSAVDLLAPDGARYPGVVTLLRGPFVAYNPPPTVGLGIGGFGFGGCCSGFGSGLGIGLPLGGPTPAAVSDQYVSSAVISLPRDYAQRWADYRVQVHLGNRTVELAAPAPIPG